MTLKVAQLILPQTNNSLHKISARVATQTVFQENFLEAIRETLFKTLNNRMSNSSKKEKDFSTREDKIIKSALMLCKDNKKNYKLIQRKTLNLSSKQFVKSKL